MVPSSHMGCLVFVAPRSVRALGFIVEFSIGLYDISPIKLILSVKVVVTRCINTVYSKRNTHLIQNFFVVPLREGGQKFTWLIM